MSRRRFHLLPPDSPLGWTPYAWLVYLPTFLLEPVIRTQQGEAGPLYWAATMLGLLVFFAAYFRGYWLRGVRLYPIVAVHTALGVVFTPINVGSCVFFVYAASFAGYLDRPRDALRSIAVIAALAAAMAYLTAAPLFFWIVGVAIAVVVGAVNVHFAQTGRAQRSLRLAQEEIRHLAAVAERERIARDLHDLLGHTLSLIVLKAELAGKLAERDPPRAAREMRDVEDVARRTLQEVREAIRGYRATLADEAARAAGMLRTAGIAAEFDVDPAGLPRAIEETLALALRESVTNVVRHAGASKCVVRLVRDGREVALLIEDDGRGGNAPEGAGLRGMRERVEAFGGRLERLPGRGMRLRVALPAAAAPDPPARREPGTHAAPADEDVVHRSSRDPGGDPSPAPVSTRSAMP